MCKSSLCVGGKNWNYVTSVKAALCLFVCRCVCLFLFLFLFLQWHVSRQNVCMCGGTRSYVSHAEDSAGRESKTMPLADSPHCVNGYICRMSHYQQLTEFGIILWNSRDLFEIVAVIIWYFVTRRFCYHWGLSVSEPFPKLNKFRSKWREVWKSPDSDTIILAS